VSSTDKAIHYIRENRETEAMIYLKENDQKIAQKLFCYLSAWDNDYKVVGETNNINGIESCDLVLIASEDVFAGDTDEYNKIKNELERKGIRIKMAVDETNEEEYMERALDLFKKV
jgi:hypothetical protein